MGRRASMIWQVIVKTINEFRQDDCMQMAGALAFFTVFSLPPLLVLVITVAGLQFGEEAVQGRIESEISAVIGVEAAEQVQTMISNAGQSLAGDGGLMATMIGGVALLFGATTAFAQLQNALNRAWNVAPNPDRSGILNYLIKRVLSFGMILVTGFLLLVSLLMSAMLSAIGSGLINLAPWLPLQMSRIIDFSLSLLMITLLFAAIFRVLPDARIAWRDVWTGAFVTALLFVAGKMLIGVYIGHSDPGSTYGAAGSLVLVLLWIYLSSILLLLGAEFAQVWARRHGEEIRPSKGAVKVKRKTFKLGNGEP